MPLGHQGAGFFGNDLGDDRLRRRAGERRLPGQHLVEHGAQRIDVAPRGDFALPHRLLRRHVERRAEAHAGFGHPGTAGAADRERNAEVRHQGLSVVEQDILRLDVAMDHAMAVGIVECARHLRCNPDGIGDGELGLAGEPVAQALSFDERHHIEQKAVGLARIEESQNMRMLEVRRGLDLGQEALRPDDRRKLRAQHLQGDPAVMPDVMRQVDGGHAAGPDLALDRVPAGEGRPKPADRFRHWRFSRGAGAGKPGACRGMGRSGGAGSSSRRRESRAGCRIVYGKGARQR